MNLKRLGLMMTAVMLTLSGCTAARDPMVSPSATSSPAPTAARAPASPSGSPGAAVSLKDGVYTARASDEYTQAAGHGWQEYLTVTVENGAIVQLDYDAVQDGKLKSETTPDVYPMTPHPSQWTPQLEASLMKADSAAAIDTVAGATASSRMARKLYTAVMEAAREGTRGDLLVE